MHGTRRSIAFLLIAALASLGACNILDVESPGKITDSSLDDPDAFPSLVYGMAYNLAQANDNVAEIESLLSGELWHGGSYDWGKIPRGIILPEDVDNSWAWIEQAQWVTDHGIARMQRVLSQDDFEHSALVAEAYLYGGFVDRLFGEIACQIVVDSGAPQPNTVSFERAKDKFTNAIRIAQNANADRSIIYAAYGGRASVNAWLGDWAAAVQDAAQVPVDFEFDAILNAAANNENTLAYETHARYEYTVWNTIFASHYGDPRAPWDTVFDAHGAIATGANGKTYMFQQQKYKTVDDDFPLTKGTEMLVLRAEAALRNNDLSGAKALLDQARAHYGMAPLSATSMATPDSAWSTLHYERAATVFLENRHLWDVRRWYAETGPAHDDYLHQWAPQGQDVRDSCMPISREEARSNPNIP
jgi:hypothetical protein